MAIQAATSFASFDVPAGAYIQDISPSLVDAVYFDLNYLEAVPLGWDEPVEDTVHYWNEEQLNAQTVTLDASVAAGGTTFALTAGHGARVPENGVLLQPRVSGNLELAQVTAGATTDSLTVTRDYGTASGPAASLPAGTELWVVDSLQEGSDILADASPVPVVRSNSTHIFGMRELKVTGTQLSRRMATRELDNWVDRQLAARALELKMKLIHACIYSDSNATPAGSDTVLRTMRGLRSFATGFGILNATGEALTLANLNSVNKSVVDRGDYVNTLLLGTDLVTSLSAIDSSNRRLYESDTAVGFTVQTVLLNQGNEVRVVIDSRVNPGEAYLFDRTRVMPMPMLGRGMFTIAATDFSDGRKRRVLAEWTQQVNNPELIGFLHSKT